MLSNFHKKSKAILLRQAFFSSVHKVGVFLRKSYFLLQWDGDGFNCFLHAGQVFCEPPYLVGMTAYKYLTK